MKTLHGYVSVKTPLEKKLPTLRYSEHYHLYNQRMENQLRKNRMIWTVIVDCQELIELEYFRKNLPYHILH